MKKVSKFMSVALVLALALSLFAGVNVFAEGESSGDPAPRTSTGSSAAPTDTPAPTEAPSAYISSYTVSGYDGDHYGRGERADITMVVVDERAANSAVDKTITARINTPAFSQNTVKDIAPGSDNKYTFLFRNVEFLGGSTTFSFEMIYGDGSPMVTLSQNLSMCDDTAPAEPTPSPTPGPTAEPDLPKVMVKDFSFGGTSVEAGKEFTLDLTLFTTSGNTNLEDVMVGLNFGEAKNVSLASGSMNTYVGTLAPGATKHITYKIITDATIEPGAIGITVQLTSKNGEPNSSPISIPVTQPDRFEITGIEAPETIMLGEEGYLSVTFVNKGKSPVNNLSAEIQGTNLANPGQSQFLGNIAAGTENSVDFNVMASAEGTINGKVLLSYEDAKGEIVTLEKEFSCTVQAMPEMDPGMMDPGMMDPTMGDGVESGMPWWGWLLIALGVAAVAAAVVLVVLKKKKAKKLAELEDDDEDI